MSNVSKEVKVRVVIPLYRSSLPEVERRILVHNINTLRNRKFTFVIPESVDIHDIEQFTSAIDHTVWRVSDDWLGARNGVHGYNAMMLSEEFYKHFAECEYILICQTDAYIFRDELDEWCSAGYDYVGAPWVKPRKYYNAIADTYFRFKRWLHRNRQSYMRQDLFDKVGNGGLSLRKTESCIEVCAKHKSHIAEFLKTKHHLNNEDVFWALYPKHFKYPSAADALKFAFDTKPAYCFELNGERLPMGCHGLGNRKILNFWSDKISL